MPPYDRPPPVCMSAKVTTLVDVVLSVVWKGECDGLGWEISRPVGGNDRGEWDSKMPMEDGARRNLFENRITYVCSSKKSL